MRNLTVSLLALFLWTGAPHVEAAPLPPMQPVTIEGTIVSVAWTPARQLKGIPLMSGSAGLDRTMPARYVVTLADVSFKGKGTGKSRLLKEDGKAEIILNHDRDDGFLKKGMRIAVIGYVERGDEGGTWTGFERIEILRKP